MNTTLDTTIQNILSLIAPHPNRVLVVHFTGLMEVMTKADAIRRVLMRDGVKYVPLTEDELPIYGVGGRVVMTMPKALQIVSTPHQRFLRGGAFRPPAPTRMAVFYRDAFICQYCGRPVSLRRGHNRPDAATIDHVIPLHRGGPKASWENLVCACSSCNHDKGSKSVSEFGHPLLKKPEAIWLRVRA